MTSPANSGTSGKGGTQKVDTSFSQKTNKKSGYRPIITGKKGYVDGTSKKYRGRNMESFCM